NFPQELVEVIFKVALAELLRLLLAFRDKHMTRDQNIVGAARPAELRARIAEQLELFLDGHRGLKSRAQGHSRPLGDVARRLGTDGANPNRWMRTLVRPRPHVDVFIMIEL